MTAMTLPAALSIRQPWAHWIIHGHETRGRKTIENRPWFSARRGWIFIHAGQQPDGRYKRQVTHDMARGAIIGVVRIVDCVPGEGVHAGRERRLQSQPMPADWPRWRNSGWFRGPYGFVLADAHALEPVPCRGRLSFFQPDLSAEQAEALASALAAASIDAAAPPPPSPPNPTLEAACEMMRAGLAPRPRPSEETAP